jgi:hypothetical protein
MRGGAVRSPAVRCWSPGHSVLRLSTRMLTLQSCVAWPLVHSWPLGCAWVLVRAGRTVPYGAALDPQKVRPQPAWSWARMREASWHGRCYTCEFGSERPLAGGRY